MSEPVLCYIDGPWAFFTTRQLEEQTGDDWNDAPYEHNAGDPYGPCWHNAPAFIGDPSQRRGLRPGTNEPLQVGEVCRCASCIRDWNDDGTPKFEIRKVAWEGPFDPPCWGDLNSRWSVDQINAGAIAWLCGDGVHIPAGTTLADFVDAITAAGGMVYLPRATT